MKEKPTLQEKLERKHMKKPPAFIYILLICIWQLLFNRKLGVRFTFRVRPSRDKNPYILISNHASRVDYLYTAPAVLPHRLNYVVGYNEFFRSHLYGIFSLMQVIPKRNFTPDLHAIKEIIRIIRKGGHVCLFPEGMSSISGGGQPCAVGSGKLLKHLGATVYYTKIAGGYMTNTKHCLDERPGRVEIVVDRLFTPEQLKRMSADEIQETLNRELKHDDYLWNREARACFKGRGEMAKNLHDMLYLCPKCGRLYTMRGEGDIIRCEACGNGARVNEYYDLIPLGETHVVPDTISHWYAMERELAKAEVSDTNFSYSGRVKLGVLPRYKRLAKGATSVIAGEGTLSLSRGGLTFTGTKNGEPFSFTLSTDAVPTYGMCTDITRFYTFFKSEFYEFYPEHNDTMRWFHLTEELHRACGGKWK
jgi:1-acyl-sn-glycerol-3-phosphate acyltransferase/ribosomal protein L37AE/L43A